MEYNNEIIGYKIQVLLSVAPWTIKQDTIGNRQKVAPILRGLQIGFNN